MPACVCERQCETTALQQLPGLTKKLLMSLQKCPLKPDSFRFLQGGRPLQSMTMAKMSLRMRSQWLFQLLFRQRCQPQLQLRCLRLCQHSHLRLQRLPCRSQRRDVAWNTSMLECCNAMKCHHAAIMLPSLLYHTNIPTRLLIPHEFPQCPAPWADGPWQDTSDYGEEDFEDEESSAPAPARAATPSQPAQPAQPQAAAPATQAQACGEFHVHSCQDPRGHKSVWNANLCDDTLKAWANKTYIIYIYIYIFCKINRWYLSIRTLSETKGPCPGGFVGSDPINDALQWFCFVRGPTCNRTFLGTGAHIELWITNAGVEPYLNKSLAMLNFILLSCYLRFLISDGFWVCQCFPCPWTGHCQRLRRRLRIWGAACAACGVPASSSAATAASEAGAQGPQRSWEGGRAGLSPGVILYIYIIYTKCIIMLYNDNVIYSRLLQQWQ